MHSFKKSAKTVFALTLGFSLAFGIGEIRNQNHSSFIYDFFQSASTGKLDTLNFSYNEDELTSIENINHNPNYYHDGNASIDEVENDFRIDLSLCKLDIGLFHKFTAMSSVEESDNSISSYLNPIYIHDINFDCQLETGDKSFKALTFTRSNMITQVHKIYKVVFIPS